MRARAGDPPRTMTQKILAGRADDPNLAGELVQVKVDQVILAREPNRVLTEAASQGMKKAAVEVAIAYETCCVTGAQPTPSTFGAVPRSVLQQNVLVARPGIGFAPAVHLERFGSPARLSLTDEPRLSSVGGIGMLTLNVAAPQLTEALVTGSVWLRPARSVQVLLSGRLRPFVCVRDVALELIRRGLGEVIQKIDAEHNAPVVIEFAGPSARLLSVPERAVLCALGPQLGAAGSVFVSDEKTEVYLRDQRRSKAHRSLIPDAGAPCDDAITVDLSAVDPLIMDEDGSVRQVRELAGKPVTQVVLGGDAGASLRDLLAAAALLKSKRVPAKLDLILAPPSRQALEVLAQSGALVDLIATGARLVEPDQRLVTGELYPPVPGGLSMRTYDPEPTLSKHLRFAVASAETLAYAVASGQVGDPRSFKRPVRVTVPRALPTDDVLIVRKAKGKAKPEEEPRREPREPQAAVDWAKLAELPLVKPPKLPVEPSAILVGSLEELRWATRSSALLNGKVRAIVSAHIPSATVSELSARGILALTANEETLKTLSEQGAVSLSDPEKSAAAAELPASAGKAKVSLHWPALERERKWVLGASRPARKAAKA